MRRPVRWAWAALFAVLILVVSSSLWGTMSSSVRPLELARGTPPPAAPLGLSAGARPEVPLASTGQLRLLVQTHDPTIVPNTGIRCTLTDWAPATLPNDTSFQVGAEETIGNYTAVFGMFENTQLNPRPFFSIFEARSDALVRLVYWNTFGAIPGTAYDFRLAAGPSTNWTLSINGFIFGGNTSTGSFNFGEPQATNASSIGFSEVAFVQTTSPVPENLSIPVAFAVLRSGNWEVPAEGYSFFSPAEPVPWGVAGRSQVAYLAPDQLLTGSKVVLSANNTTLWSGGAVPVSVTLSASSSNPVGTGGEILAVTVAIVGNTTIPLDNVSIFMQDTLGSVFSPAPAYTSTTGNATISMIVANVTVPMFDTVTASVQLIGYSGSASIGFEVTPPPQVLFSVHPATVDVAQAATYTLAVEAVYANGLPAAFLEVAASVTGPASIEPVVGTTGATGWLNLTLAVDGGVGQVVLLVGVNGGGAWGTLLVDLGSHEAVSFWAMYGGYVFLAVGAVLVAVAVVLVRRLLRRRHPMPDMGFSPDQETAMPADARHEGFNRKPPEGGTP